MHRILSFYAHIFYKMHDRLTFWWCLCHPSTSILHSKFFSNRPVLCSFPSKVQTFASVLSTVNTKVLYLVLKYSSKGKRNPRVLLAYSIPATHSKKKRGNNVVTASFDRSCICFSSETKKFKRYWQVKIEIHKNSQYWHLKPDQEATLPIWLNN